MLSSSRATTIQNYLTVAADQKQHDAVLSVSIFTRLSAYECRAILRYPYVVDGNAPVPTVRSASVQIVYSIPASSSDITGSFENFKTLAGKLPLITGSVEDLSDNSIFTALAADLESMTADLITPTTTSPVKQDPETAFIVPSVPEGLRAAA